LGAEDGSKQDRLCQGQWSFLNDSIDADCGEGQSIRSSFYFQFTNGSRVLVTAVRQFWDSGGMTQAGWGWWGLILSRRMILAFPSLPSGHLTNKLSPSARAGIPTFLLRPENFSFRFNGGSYTAVYSVPSRIRETSRHESGKSLREISAFTTNNAGNVDTVLNRRIDTEEYCAGKVRRSFGRAFNTRAFNVI
jgi:hypothetical protein